MASGGARYHHEGRVLKVSLRRGLEHPFLRGSRIGRGKDLGSKVVSSWKTNAVARPG